MTTTFNALTGATAPMAVTGIVPAGDDLKYTAAQLAGYHSLLDYGAAGNGSTDDTTALTNALAAASTGPFRTVYLPPGKTFKITASPTAPTSLVTILIDGTLAPSANVSLPLLASIVVRPGGSIAPSGSAVATILGPFSAPLVQVFGGTGTISFTGNKYVEKWYPQWWGVVGDGTLYSTTANLSIGATTITGLPSTQNFAVGQGCVIRSGRARATIALGNDSGWATANANVTFSTDSGNHTAGSAGAKFACASTIVMGTEIGSFTLATAQDWSTYDEIRFDAKVSSIAGFSKFHPGGLVVALYNSSGTLVSRMGCNGNLSPSTPFLRFSAPLDQQTALTDVKTISLYCDSLTNTSNRPLSLAKADTGGAIASTGVGFNLWVDNVCVTADLYTTVTAVPSSTSITVADALGAALPDTTLSNVDSNRARGVYHDDTVPLAACLAAVPDFGEVVFTPGMTIPTTTVTVLGRQGMKLSGPTGGGSSSGSISVNTPKFLYVGRSGQNHFFFNRSRGLVIEGLDWLNDGPMPPQAGLNFDMVGSATSVINSHSEVRRCYVKGPLGYPNYCGTSISRNATSNCEFIRHKDVWVETSDCYPGVGTGFYVGGSFNAKTEVYEECSTGNGQYGWRTDGGSIVVKTCSADFNGVDFVLNGGAEPNSIDNCNFEYSGGCVSTNAPYPLRVANCRWSEVLAGSGATNSLSGAFLLRSAAGAVRLLENKVFPSSTVSSPALLDPATAGGTLDSQGNYYNYAASLNNLWLVNNGAVSRGDRWASGGPSVQGEVFYEQSLYAVNGSNATKHLLGRTTKRNNVTRGMVSLDEDADGVKIGGFLEVAGGGLHLKKQVLTTGTYDLTSSNAVHDQVGGIVFLDASAGQITVSFTNPNDYKSPQPATPVWEFRRVDTTSNVVRVSPYSRGQSVEAMDSAGWRYVAPGEVVRIACDGASSAKYWDLGTPPTGFVTDSWASTTTLDWAKATKHALTLGGATTLVFSNLRAGAEYILELIQDGTGSRTVTWPTEAKFAGGAAPTLTTTAGKTDVLRGFSDGTSLFWTSVSLNMASPTSTPAAPVADFSGTPTTGTNSTDVAFTNTSTGTYTTSAWDFGDGATSTLTSPTHTYTLAGAYTVSLTVTGPGGSDNETKTAYITISGASAPVADFSANATGGTAPLTVTFTNLTSGGPVDTYSWDFGDGGTSTSTSPIHVYASAGTYTVALTATGPGGADTETKTGYITVTAAGAPANQISPLQLYLAGEIPPGLQDTQLSGADLVISRPLIEVLGAAFK